MSSRPLLIAGIGGGVLAGVALFVLALALVAIDGSALSGSVMAMLVLGAALGWALDAAWICLALDRLAKIDRGSDGEDGHNGEGWGGPRPSHPRPPSQDPDWWPEFERDLRAELKARDRAPVPG